MVRDSESYVYGNKMWLKTLTWDSRKYSSDTWSLGRLQYIGSRIGVGLQWYSFLSYYPSWNETFWWCRLTTSPLCFCKWPKWMNWFTRMNFHRIVSLCSMPFLDLSLYHLTTGLTQHLPHLPFPLSLPPISFPRPSSASRFSLFAWFCFSVLCLPWHQKRQER